LTEASASATVAPVSAEQTGHSRPDAHLDSTALAAAGSPAGWKQWVRTYGPLVAAVAYLADRAIAGVLAKVGHAGAALDDAYIHFQYARAIAEGHPFRFQASAPATSGSTSLLWPALLAPFWAVGLRDDAIVWAAWAMSFAALGGLAWEATRLTERLAGRSAAIGAGAMTLAFGGFAWGAASGMEIVPFAWSIARATRVASAWAEGAPAARTRKAAAELVALAWVAAFFRPEGAVAALFVAAALLAFPGPGSRRVPWIALGPIAAIGAVPLVLWLATGSPRSATAVAKLLPGNPYFPGPQLLATVQNNVATLLGKLLNGEVWSAEFLPHGGAPVAMAGLGAVVVCAARTRRPWTAAGVLLLALTIFAPCFYVTFLWNRLRYLWPFATGWIIGLACLARVVGDLAGAVRPRWRVVTGIGCGVLVGLFASKLEWVLEDVAQSASGIDRQQVALGRWAKASLSTDARIGVNDTGAIAYFGDRTTFDIVGLTTRDEARYWVAGVGSRFEHYERLHASGPASLPTHFIVYPEWMGLDAVLGRALHQATVTDSTILGGQTMRAYEADWSTLGTGERPWSDDSEPIDAVDVADLESEAEHHYALAGARDGEETAHEGVSPRGAVVVDGGRTNRTIERFTAHLHAGKRARGIVRFDAPPGATLQVLVGGEPVQTIAADSGNADDAADSTDAGDWVERSFGVPASLANANTAVELRVSGGPATVYHYWFVEPR
jgi:hypothetical protein